MRLKPWLVPILLALASTLASCQLLDAIGPKPPLVPCAKPDTLNSAVHGSFKASFKLGCLNK